MKNVLQDCAPTPADIRRLGAQVGAAVRNLTDFPNPKSNKRTFAAVATFGLAAAAITVPVAAGPAEVDPETGVIRADTGSPDDAAEFEVPETTTFALAAAAAEAGASLEGTDQFSAYNVSPDSLYEIRRAQWVVEELQARAERGSTAPSSADVKPAIAKAADELLAEVANDIVGQVPAAEVTETMLIEALSQAAATLETHVTQMAEILAQRPALPDTSATGSPTEVLYQLAWDAQADADRISQYQEATAGYGNGEIPREYMCQLSTFEWHVLRCDAAIQFERLNAAFRAEFGYDLEVTDSFRSLEQQIEAKAAKPKLAGKPGTSNHGWGQAVDFAGEIHQGYDNAEYLWMYQNAPLFGWHNPDWARPGGQKAEPWHWEFNGKYADIAQVLGDWDAEPAPAPIETPEDPGLIVPDPEPTPITPELPPVEDATPEAPTPETPSVETQAALAPTAAAPTAEVATSESATAEVPTPEAQVPAEVRMPVVGATPAPIRAVVPDGVVAVPIN